MALVSSAADDVVAPLALPPAAADIAAPPLLALLGASVRRTLALHSCAASSTSCRPKLH